ncbi:DUF6168 family protein [Tenacibaculum finnmarkense]|uniref:Uncharacterized protein n=1 Tax=Tenacibaculum finnmarkense genomovar ulcerans TaxID=2781388 RepID=A0A2I2M7Y9_9FLAO|nr:DUF6168 family protein [Tenacibaculum finnmarkense]MBE7633466.1 hypothetical protein [Tenacibaculum finnmarkense genomovar ulcerans]MBE7647259.1 hypothetical protein [Tenacibaculum finnmarkense genomovar ulcerans]MBE7687032.1 hypothetical protein [Tenacibaculum finnmarkense genomovar ulcerans]MBE7696593.1 hypothetical protein [Tenacibaculum finnmarkense genomovar ulcerans]MCD8399385.1 DUF6168 family protein [Tenacibaculum finnmarkense genomovar ulcerans]
MIKRILYFIALIMLLFAVGYGSHNAILNMRGDVISYSLFSVYLFHVVATSIIYALFELLASQLPNEAGYGYLASMLLKIGFFVLIFQKDVFTGVQLSQPEKVSLVIPLFLFLITEAMGVFKLLNSK